MLLLTRILVLEYLGDVTVAPVTSTVREIPSEVGSPERTECRKIAVNCDHLQTVSKSRLGALLTTLSTAKMREVAQAVAFALGFGG